MTMTLDSEKIVRLFELCQEILDTRREVPMLDAAMTGETDRAVQLQMAENVRDSLLTNHVATLKELAKVLR